MKITHRSLSHFVGILIGLLVTLCVSATGLLISCQDSGVPIGSILDPCASTADVAGVSGITYTNFVGPLFQAQCSGGACHSGAGSRSFSIDSYCSVVTGGASGQGVVAGKPAQSVAYQALFANNGIVVRMPDGLPTFAQSTLDSIRVWIEEGAPFDDIAGNGGGNTGGGGGGGNTDTCGISYNNFVAPLFAANCAGAACHSGSGQGGYSVDNYASVLAGGGKGIGITPGDTALSVAYKVLFPNNGLTVQMPDGLTALSVGKLDSLKQWILSGAPQASACDTTGGGGTPAPLTYDDYIGPLLILNCGGSSCHTGSTPERGLSVETYQRLLQGGVNGPGITPNNLANSTIYQSLFNNNGVVDRMPPVTVLRSSAIDSIRLWVLAGASQTQ